MPELVQPKPIESIDECLVVFNRVAEHDTAFKRQVNDAIRKLIREGKLTVYTDGTFELKKL